MALRLEHLFDQGLAASPQAAALLKSSRGKTRRRVSASRATFAAIRATLQRLVVKDEDKTSMEVKDGDESSTTKDTIHFLPFWDNGVRFFTIEGPNKEKIEFSQYL